MKPLCCPLLGAMGAMVMAGCTGVPATDLPAAPAARVAVPPVIVLPRVARSNPAPVYPKELRRAERQGMVHVECVVDAQGQVLMAAVQDSTDPEFNRITLNAVRGWTFGPGTRDGVPVTMRVVVPVRYSLVD